MGQTSLLIDADERKRLGQYFTGKRLASLLAHLALADRARSVIDPMAGTGDMLMAARAAGAVDARFAAVEIDADAAATCAERLSDGIDLAATVCRGDAFSHETWRCLDDQPWDLVITNPPYVRYQRTASASRGRVSIPSARSIREGLIDFIQRRSSLSPADRVVMSDLAAGYSGLADLAVPSWLLCASLVAVGGRLAMVVPDTWLSRNYALPVLYLLQRYFEIEVIVEDPQSVWFEDALVRTTLLIAHRVEDRGTALGNDARGYVRARLDNTTINDHSIVGTLLPDSEAPDRDFAGIVRSLTNDQQSLQLSGCSISWVTDESAQELLSGATNANWLRAVESVDNETKPGVPSATPVHIPRSVRAMANGLSADWLALADHGWSVGQGLRTGANMFFYGERLRSDRKGSLLAVDPTITRDPLDVPPSLLKRVIRSQGDLEGGFTASASTRGRVISLQNHALPEDLADGANVGGINPYSEVPEPLASHIRRAALTDVSRNGHPKLIPMLSAVATNVRKADVLRPDRLPRYWYQLPEFASRHTPALFMPRVNHGHPRTFANPESVLVDANFSTMWRHDETGLPVSTMLALLNSTWISLVLEDAATILGGGALKVEAAHLRRVPLPVLNSRELDELTRLGSELIDASPDAADVVLQAIDAIVWPRVLGTATNAALGSRRLHELNESLLSERASISTSRRQGLFAG